ncbi:MAG: arsenate reductase ArsC [Desulfamplus sp.]
MDQKIKVLFICVHNSARSQMAEAFLKELGGGRFFVESAGLEAGTINPLAVAVMKEAGIDISGNKTKSAFDFFKQGKLYNYVVTVCDASAGERCPIFPGITKRLHWGFDDPSSLTGTEEEKLEKTRKIRDQIKEAVEIFIKNIMEKRND